MVFQQCPNKNADIAMYKSKETGKNKYTLFDTKMEDELNRNTAIVIFFVMQ